MAVQIVQLTLPMFLGCIVNWLLFGVLLVQIYIYYAAFPQDNRWSKIAVALVLFLEVVETISDTRDTAKAFGAGWGNVDVLDAVGWAWFSVPVMSPLIASVGQGFFAFRIYVIGRRSIWLPIIISLVSLLQLASGIWTGVNICIAGKFSLLQEHNAVATSLWLASTSFCDLLIVFGMVYHLWGSHEREFSRISSAVSRILLLTVETGLLCVIFALVDLYLFLGFKGTNYHLGVCIELSKIYSNSILLIFNSRVHISYRDAQDTQRSFNLSVPSSRSRTRNSTIQFSS
ncbi:hypothetical protein C8F01DRAFT_1230091, partial [Mycena amicta]